MDVVLRKIYTGKALEKKVTLPNGEELTPYLPSKELIEAVNIAAILGRPLLIKGEPGCGKTKLAASIAYELHKKKIDSREYNLEDIYFELHVKSNGRAMDGLYRYDYIKRLQHAQLSTTQGLDLIEEEEDYIKYGSLGKAFIKSNIYSNPVVVLIDEIDKADADFPNDLLRELDEMKFTVEEQKKTITANKDKKPVIIITSNNERELPLPFLRRCIFHHIDFPTEDRLREIVKAHFSEMDKQEQIVFNVVKVFNRLRKEMDNEKDDREKKISTSELIDWCSILLKYEDKEIEEILTGKIPFSSILFKNREDILRFSTAHLDNNK